LTAELVLIWSVRSYFSSLWLVLAAIVSGAVYLGVWSVRTALPLYRNQMEIGA
jgi:hypothetical protein